MVMVEKIPGGFKQTEVGTIPNDWDAKPINDFCELTSSKRIFESEYTLSGIPFYRGKEISLLIENKKIQNEYFISQGRYENLKKQFGAPKKNDILITAVGTLGNIYLVPDEKKFYFKDGNLIWLRKINGIDPNYLSIQIGYNKKQIIENAIGSSQKALTIIVLKKQLIPLPPTKVEQTAIATALNDVDSLITQLEKLIAKKRAIKQGAMQELLKPKEGCGVTRFWELLESNSHKPMLKPEDQITFLGMEDVSGNGKIIKQNLMPYFNIKKGLTPFRKNDVIVAKITPCFENGKGACLDTLGTEYGFGSTEFHVLRVNENTLPRFIFYHTQTHQFRKKLELEMTGTAGQKRVSMKSIWDYQIFVPPIEEQQQVVQILSDMDTEIETLEKNLDKYRMIKQGMMQVLLTGKVRLIKNNGEL